MNAMSMTHVGRDIAYYHQIEGQAEQQVCEKSYNEREENKPKKRLAKQVAEHSYKPWIMPII